MSALWRPVFPKLGKCAKWDGLDDPVYRCCCADGEPKQWSRNSPGFNEHTGAIRHRRAHYASNRDIQICCPGRWQRPDEQVVLGRCSTKLSETTVSGHVYGGRLNIMVTDHRAEAPVARLKSQATIVLLPLSEITDGSTWA